MIPSCILLNPVTKADLQAACVQAEAALQAGMVQASATTTAGWLTFGAGAFAIIAALTGGWLTIRNTREQIRAARTDLAEQLHAAGEAQTKQRTHDLKSAVYIPAVRALATGLSVVVKLADLRSPIQNVMDEYTQTIPDFMIVHLVAKPETAESLLTALRGLQELHQGLLPDRPRKRDGPYDREEAIQWSRRCTTKLEEAVPSMVSAIAAMRGELDMPIDEQAYAALIRNGLKAVIERNERLFAEMLE